MRRNATAIYIIHRGTSASAHPHRPSPPPWFNERTIMSIATGTHGSTSISKYPSLPSTTYSRGRRSTTRQPASNWTSYTQGAGTVHLDSRQQPDSSGSAATPTSTSLLPIYERGSNYSYSSSGTTLRGQKYRRQAAWNELDEKNDAVSSTTCQELLHEETAKILQIAWYIMGTAQGRLHDMGDNIPPRAFRNACKRCVDRQTPDD